MEKWITRAWYGGVQWTWIFWPLMLLYRVVVTQKRNAYLQNPPQKAGLPVVVVGNITAGGTGKTPVVQSLVRLLQQNGIRPAIITRGYGGNLTEFPHVITQQDSPELVGDEPCMMFHSLKVPVVVDPKRARAAQYCADNLPVDVILCDDGLQHYALARDIEVCVIDAQREFGNCQLIPVGPLREPIERLNHVDFIFRNGKGADGNDDLTPSTSHCASFQLEPVAWVNLKSQERLAPADLPSRLTGGPVQMLAGIGNPERFFDTVRSMGIEAASKAFPDHHAYTVDDFDSTFANFLMTEKDAIKVLPFATERMWYLEVSAQLPEPTQRAFISKIKQLMGNQHG